MGHSRVGRLSLTRRWRQVIALIGDGAGLDDIAGATAVAAESSMIDAADDPAFRHSIWLLTQIPLAARQGDHFASALRQLGLKVSAVPTLVEICTAMVSAIDERVQRSGTRSDAGEMAELAAVESLAAVAGRESNTLFGASHAAADTLVALKGLSTERQFTVLARDFFSRLTRKYLDYYLSRELPQHVGADKRFQTMREHRAFEEALDLHCREASRIIDESPAPGFRRPTTRVASTRRRQPASPTSRSARCATSCA
jgi:hypothetical protein